MGFIDMKYNMFFSILIFFFVCIEINIGAGITLGRIAYLLSFFSVIFLGLKIDKRNVKFTLFLFIMAFLNALYMFSSFSFVDFDYLRVINWIVFSVYSLFCLMLFSSLYENEREILYKYLILISAFFIFISIIFLIKDLGLNFYSFPSWQIRGKLNDLPGGLSRYFFAINMYLFIVFFLSKNKKNHKWILFLGVILVLISGSRQFLVVWLFGFLTLFLVSSEYRNKFLKLKSIVVFSTFIVVLALFSSGDFFNSLEQRYAQTFELFDSQQGNEENSTTERLHYISAAVTNIERYPLGIGPGGIDVVIGRPAHNSFAHLAIETGFLGMFIYIVFGIYIAYCLLRQSKNYFVCFNTVYFLGPMFNDVIFMSVFWTIIFYIVSSIRRE